MPTHSGYLELLLDHAHKKYVAMETQHAVFSPFLYSDSRLSALLTLQEAIINQQVVE